MNIVPRERLAVANQLNYVSVYGMVPVAAVIFALLSTVASFFGVPDVCRRRQQRADQRLHQHPGHRHRAGHRRAAPTSSPPAWCSCRGGMIPSFVGDRSTTKNIFSLIAEGVSFVRKNKLMRSIYIGILGAFGAGGLVAGVAQAYVATLGAGNAGYGILFGSVFTGLALGMLIGPKVFPTVPRRMIFTPAIGAAGISLIVMSVLQDFLGAVHHRVRDGRLRRDRLDQRVHHDRPRGVRPAPRPGVRVRHVLGADRAAGDDRRRTRSWPVRSGPYQVTVGDFRFDITGPAIVLAVGGLIAFGVSLFIGRQIGGLTSGLTRRIFGRRGVNIWDEQDDHAGVLIAVEGADAAGRGPSMRTGSRSTCAADGWLTVRVQASHRRRCTTRRPRRARQRRCGPSADLADLTTDRVRPALEARRSRGVRGIRRRHDRRAPGRRGRGAAAGQGRAVGGERAQARPDGAGRRCRRMHSMVR